MSIFSTRGSSSGNRRATLNLLAGSLWYAPASFGLARVLGSRCALRSILFHHIADAESCFTKGLRVTVTRKQFEAALKFIKRHYTPVSLEVVIADPTGKHLPARPVLVTFDDAYASVREFAAPLCYQLGVPAVFFVNGSCLDNRQLALENLICYVVNVFGLDTLNAAMRSVNVSRDFEVSSLSQVFSDFLPATSLTGRAAFRNALIEISGINEADLAAEAALYLSAKQLRSIVNFGFEIGNHTYSHANCRSLSSSDFAEEIDRNKAVLHAISGANVRSFSVPYGSSVDLTSTLAEHLRLSGYKAVFLAEGRGKSLWTSASILDRVSIQATTDSAFFSEIEVLPRLRTIRSLLSNSEASKQRKEPAVCSKV
jgi:peptidoglycan/xylan/chitin deacetylase (PgdA/CDA1 family)